MVSEICLIGFCSRTNMYEWLPCARIKQENRILLKAFFTGASWVILVQQLEVGHGSQNV